MGRLTVPASFETEEQGNHADYNFQNDLLTKDSNPPGEIGIAVSVGDFDFSCYLIICSKFGPVCYQ